MHSLPRPSPPAPPPPAPPPFRTYKWAADFGDLSNKKQVEKLTTALRPFFLRRMKADVEKSVPPKEETVVQVELTSVQKQW